MANLQDIPFHYYMQDTPFFIIDGEPLFANDAIYRAFEAKSDFEDISKSVTNYSLFQTLIDVPGVLKIKNLEKTCQ